VSWKSSCYEYEEASRSIRTAIAEMNFESPRFRVRIFQTLQHILYLQAKSVSNKRMVDHEHMRYCMGQSDEHETTSRASLAVGEITQSRSILHRMHNNPSRCDTVGHFSVAGVICKCRYICRSHKNKEIPQHFAISKGLLGKTTTILND
jgi:hypothetical protein